MAKMTRQKKLREKDPQAAERMAARRQEKVRVAKELGIPAEQLEWRDGQLYKLGDLHPIDGSRYINKSAA
jgi:protoporphyrinogen oxidase